MSRTCLGVTLKKNKCYRRVKYPQCYCYEHKNQEILEKTVKSTSPLYQLENKIYNDVCSICLCEVEEQDDCHLQCGHPHHVMCIKQIIKPNCPQCCQPLIFKQKNEVDLQKIKNKEKEFVKEMQDQSTQETINQLTYEDDDDIKKAIEQSLLQQEIEQYEIMAQIAEESYHQAEQETLQRKEKLQKLSLHEWLDEIFNHQQSITIKLQ